MEPWIFPMTTPKGAHKADTTLVQEAWIPISA